MWINSFAATGARARTEMSSGRRLDLLCRLAAAVLLSVWVVGPWAKDWIAEAVMPDDAQSRAAGEAGTGASAVPSPTETLYSFYAGAPFYYRSNLHLTRPDGTDVTLKRLGWDGDALYFPIDGGVRGERWWNNVGLMLDFLHNKAIARLGRGSHGRKISNPVIDEVEAVGTIAGKPAPAKLKLTDVFERMEFTHGHNVLLLTPMISTGTISPRVRPYFGIGGGFALPHVEVWFPGGNRDDRTNEYQFAGPAAQLIAGLSLRSGKWSYFIEYKYTWAAISGALTGDESWKNFNMPGDLWRQFGRWWRGEKPKLGTISTTLGAHQVVAGFGRWFESRGAR